MLVEANYDYGLVVLSLVIAVLGSYLALGIASKAIAGHGVERHAVLWSGAAVMGLSIWAMHFVGILAYQLPVAVGYDISITLLSLVVAIFASSIAFYLITHLGFNFLSWILGSLSMASATGGMHYTGMLAMHIEGVMHYDLWVVVMSLLIAMAVSLATLRLVGVRLSSGATPRWGLNRYHLLSSLISGLGIAAVHYMAMEGMIVYKDDNHVVGAMSDSLLSHSDMALLVLLLISLSAALVPLIIKQVRRRVAPSKIGRFGYWLATIAVLGFTLLFFSQWFMVKAFEKESSLLQVGYRLQADIGHAHLIYEHKGEGDVSWGEFDDFLQDAQRSIGEALMIDASLSGRETGRLVTQLNALSEMITLWSGEVRELYRLPSNQVDEVARDAAMDFRYSAILNLVGEVMVAAHEMEGRNRIIFTIGNGVSLLLYILMFSSVIYIMQRRQAEVVESNNNLNQTLSELQWQKDALDYHAIVAITDPAGRITYVNDEFCRISRYSREELLGQPQSIVNSGYHSAEFWQNLWKTISSGKVWKGEIKNRRKDGRYYWVATTIVPFMDASGRPLRYLAMRTDITNSKDAEEALREKDYWMSVLINALPDEVLLVDDQDHWLIANEVMLKNLGLADVNYVGRTSGELATENEIVRQRMSICRGSDNEVWSRGSLSHWEIEYPTIKGSAVFDVVKVPLINEDGSRKGLLKLSRDITGRKKMEEENQILASAIFQADEGIFIADANGIVEYVNPAYEELLVSGYLDIVGKRIPLISPEDDSDGLLVDIWETLSRGESWSGRYDGELGVSDRAFQIMATISPIYTVKGIRYVGVVRDISEEVLMEDRLRQGQKMEAIGRLAGGIAHDFNNILTAIIGYSDLIIEDLPTGSDAYVNMKEIQLASQRAKELVKQILTFSRQSRNEGQQFEAQPVLKEGLRLIRATLPASINIEQDIIDEPLLLDMDPTQLHQVVMNLSVNAAQAIGEHGVIKVILDKVPLSQVEALLEREDIPRSTYYAKLTVQDSGPGVADDVIDHVFEPFFTTKEVGKGTGMGLAAIHGIATTNQGAITVSNREEGGACFEVFLPIADAMPPPGMETPPEALQPSGKHCAIDVLGNVLYVDDEISLTNVMGKFLERQGFDVDVANDPLQALALFKASPDKYHVVVSDQVMPNMRGDQLAEAILKLRPKLPFVICSGYSESLNADKVQSLGVREFLQKPLDFKIFSELLKKLIKEYEA